MNSTTPTRRHLLRWSLFPLLSVSPWVPVWAHGDAHPKPASDTAPLDTEQMPWGVAAHPKSAKRVIDIAMSDDMRFSPQHLNIRLHETVRLRVKNRGNLMHELVIGTDQALAEHEAMMLKHPNMEHDAPYMSHVAPHQNGDITWTFNRAGQFAFACLIPGHSQAGMRGTIRVSA